MLLFVILVILLGFAIAFAIAFPYIYRYYYSRNFHKIFENRIERFCKKNRFTDLDLLKIKNIDNELLTIDHLIFGNKNIYLIEDFYCNNDVYGKQIDNSLLIRNDKNKTSFYVENPYRVAEQKISSLTRLLSIDKNLFIPVVIYNPNCNFINSSKANNMCCYKKIRKIINNFESTNEQPLNHEQVVSVINEIAKLNIRDVK